MMQTRASWRPWFWPAIAVTAGLLPATPALAQRGDSIPSQAYYLGVEELYRGEFRDAQRAFNRALRGGVKTLDRGGMVRWVDSICYHAMLGETYYHWGQPAQALEQYNFACSLFLQYPRWMLRVQFDRPPVADPALARVGIPWGVPQRRSVPGRFAKPMNVSQGQLDQSAAVQQGGVVQQLQLWPVDVVEILRCTSLAIRRRNEILGPLGPHDTISKNLVANLSRGGAPPNHWSGAWIDVQRGLAHAGVGESEQAVQYLSRGTLVAGQFDHPLTCVALLEQGRLALAEGNAAAAASFFAEAGYSAYLYADVGVIDDAFRWGELSRIAGNARELNPALEPALTWARRERFEYVASRLSLALAEELTSAGNWKNAAAALAAGGAQLGDARTGVLGNWAAFLEAKLEYAQGRNSAPTKLQAALVGQSKISLQNFQINLANSMFDAQTLPARSAPEVYEALLADPTPADAVLWPLQSMAVMSTPHEAAFERWLLAVLERKNLAAATEITDRAKRRRFHNALPWGGRLAAVRDILFAPAAALAPAQRQQQNDLLMRFADFDRAATAAKRLHDQIDAAWQPAADAAQRTLARAWEDYADAIGAREEQLAQVALARVPADYSFPPLLAAADLQARLTDGQAILVYHDTPQGMLGMLITQQAATHWNCGPSARLGGLVSQFLRDLGNHDATRELTVEELKSDDWQKSGEKLFHALFEGASLNPAAVKELVIVPDGVVWYVPFEALLVKAEERTAPFISFAQVRYAPTIGLAYSFEGPWRRVKRTGIVVGELPPGEKPEARIAAVKPIAAAVSGPLLLAPPGPAPSPAVASLLDSLIVLADVEAQSDDPLAWSPLPLDRLEQQGALAQWLAISGAGPQRVLLPGMHTIAERGGKAARRRGPGGAPGDELFFASCSLMSAGAETLLLSRWRVGGQSTLDLMREFVQELPHMPAAAAWQRSVQLAMDMPIDPLVELRVKAGKEPVELTAAHPFFWSGYLIVDSGWRPVEDEPVVEAGAEALPVDPAAVPPAPGQPPAAAPPAEVAPEEVPDEAPPAEDSPANDAAPTDPPPPPTPPSDTPPNE